MSAASDQPERGGRPQESLLSSKLQGLLAALILFLLAGLCLLSLKHGAVRVLKERVQKDLLTTAHLAASAVDADAHSRLRDASQQNGEDYLKVVTPLRRMLKATSSVKYIYTVRKSEAGIRFMVDSADPVDADNDGVIDQAGLNEPVNVPGDAMLRAFATAQPAVSEEPYTDKWGTFISAFVPVRTADGRVECLLGVDITAEDFQRQLNAINRVAYLSLGLAAMSSAGLGVGVAMLSSRRRKSLAALERSRSLTRLLTDNMTDLVGITDHAGKTIYLSASVERVLGWTSDELGRASYTARIHPEDQHIVNRARDANLRGQSSRIRYRAMRKDGAYLWLECSAKAVLDANGKLNVIVWSSRDVTAEVSAELSLGASEARLSATIAAMAEGVLVQDRSGQIVECNPEAESILGLTRRQLMGRESIEPQWRSIHEDNTPFPSEDHPAMVTLRTGKAQRGVIMGVHHRDGRLVWISINSEPIGKTNGKPDFVVCSFSDITEQRRINAELRNARDSAETANRAKSEFLANMSHEIRTPMTAILGYTELLAEELSAEGVVHGETITTIRRNGEHLLAIINNILDLSKIEAGKMTLEHVATNPAELIEDVFQLLRHQAADKGIGLRREYATPIPRSISGDPVRLRQIMLNLAGNAVKFTERGEVKIVCSCEMSSSNDGHLNFDVIDSGIGISSDQLGRLFGCFEQADASMTRRFGGTGLGLRISRQLAMLMGGDVTVQSEPGRGSTFRLRLPVQCLERWQPPEGRQSQPSPLATPLEGLKILVVEDGVDNQRLINTLLRRAGAEVTVVDNGRRALDLLAEPVASGATFNLVLMDMQMPELDGYATVSLLRSRGCTLPVIALTGHTRDASREKCLSAGCDGYLEKPLDRFRLIEACRELARGVAGPNPTGGAESTCAFPATNAGD